MQGHWLFAKLGKRILRPGGRLLTARLLEQAKPASSDDIVELGPGVGATAEVLLRSNPHTYRGVDPNPEGRDAVKDILRRHPDAEYVVADAQDTGLPDASADLVVGEAMLTIQSQEAKHAIVAEAARLLRPGGRYAMHEMAWLPDFTDEERETARKELSRIIKVGARPLTLEGWPPTAWPPSGTTARPCTSSNPGVSSPTRACGVHCGSGATPAGYLVPATGSRPCARASSSRDA